MKTFEACLREVWQERQRDMAAEKRRMEGLELLLRCGEALERLIDAWDRGSDYQVLKNRVEAGRAAVFAVEKFQGERQ